VTLWRDKTGDGMKLAVALVASLALVIGSGCGGDDSESADTKPAAPKAVTLSIETKQFAATRGDLAELEGTVAPADATVEVDGLTAQVTAGRWTARVKLDDVGENEVEVMASAPGRKEATATTVLVRERTKAERAAARERRARAAERRRAGAERAAERRRIRQQQAAERAAAREAARQTTVPSVVGERLDVARVHLNDAGLGVRIIGGGTFGVVVEENWTVCATEPPGGGPAEKGDRIRVIVDRVC
jgi:Glucodextranase, domain B/PASTA domain